MIVDGKAIAAKILARTKTRAERLAHRPLVVALVDAATPATESYLKIKAARAAEAGCVFDVRPVGAATSDADAVVVQLPVRNEVRASELCDAILLDKDADVLSRAARARFENGEAGALLPPVVAAVQEILASGGVGIAGLRAAVVGQGFLVGAPVAVWLRQQGAQVVVAIEEEGSLANALADAQVVVLGAGSPGLVIPDLLPEGVVLIDAGTSESSGRIVGDADPSCASRCALFTPVPGGVGPVAVACLFENVVTLAERRGSGILPV